MWACVWSVCTCLHERERGETEAMPQQSVACFCACVCVCYGVVCEREREREKEGGRVRISRCYNQKCLTVGVHEFVCQLYVV